MWNTVYIDVDGVIEEITSTPGHKYYLPENDSKRDLDQVQEHQGYTELSNKWVSAKDLKKDDKVLLSSGKYGIIIKVETKEFDEPEITYNFEVADFHTYYVGENSVCVHNANCGLADDIANSADDVHGNSLKSTRTNYGYRLVDRNSGEILKFGESIRGTKRYSNVFYESTNSRMVILTQGTKAEVHIWQHNQIVSYFDEFGHLPPLNKSFW